MLPSPSFDAHYFDSAWAQPDPWRFWTSSYEQRKYDLQIRMVQAHQANVTRILEIGCAEGAHTAKLLEAFPRATLLGVDISDVALARARANVPDPRAEFRRGGVAEVVSGLAGEAFDLVVWSESVYYVAHETGPEGFRRLMDELVLGIAPGGLLCMANILDHVREPEAALTRSDVMAGIQAGIARVMPVVASETHEAEKTESRRRYRYALWLFRKPG